MQEKKQSDTTQQPVPPADGVALRGLWVGGSEGRSGSHQAGLVQKQPYWGGKAPTYEWRRGRELRMRTRLCGGRVARG